MSERDTDAASGVLVNLRVTSFGSPWQLAAGWAVLAGLGATAGARAVGIPWTTLLLAVLLADAAWGGLWRQSVGSTPTPAAMLSRRGLRLPYAGPNGIAGQVGWLSYALHGWLPAMVLAAAMAVFVGEAALALTGAVAVLGFGGWVLLRVGQAGAARWLHALALGAAPFALGVWLAPDAPSWPELGWLLMFGAAVCVLLRAGLAVAAAETQGLLLAGGGSLLMVATLLWAGRPLAAGLAAAVATGPLLLLSRNSHHPAHRLAAVQGWWWLLTLGVAMALGLEVG